MAKQIPDGYHTVTPYLMVRGAAGAIAFYAKAFGAEEVYRLPGPGGAVMHAEMRLGDSRVMLSDESAEWDSLGPQSRGGTTVSLHLYVSDADAAVRRAAGAGCTVLMPVQMMPWGDRFGKLRDPYGHEWTVATHVEDVEPAEIARRMEKFGCGGSTPGAVSSKS